MGRKASKNIRSAHTKKNHISIIVRVESEEHCEDFWREIKKAIIKLNHLLPGKVSYEMYFNVKDSDEIF